MTTWISTHGVGVIKDTSNTFSVSIEGGDAYVKPTVAGQLTGVVHFTIPSPPRNNPTLSSLRVDFSSQSAVIDSVAVYFANDEKFSKHRLQKTSSFELQISQAAAVYAEHGISVAVGVKFSNIDSAIIFQSVGIAVQ